MKGICGLVFFLASMWGSQGFTQFRTIHVLVALCDNEHQGIVPVPQAIGDGKNANLVLLSKSGPPKLIINIKNVVSGVQEISLPQDSEQKKLQRFNNLWSPELAQ